MPIIIVVVPGGTLRVRQQRRHRKKDHKKVDSQDRGHGSARNCAHPDQRKFSNSSGCHRRHATTRLFIHPTQLFIHSPDYYVCPQPLSWGQYATQRNN